MGKSISRGQRGRRHAVAVAVLPLWPTRWVVKLLVRARLLPRRAHSGPAVSTFHEGALTGYRVPGIGRGCVILYLFTTGVVNCTLHLTIVLSRPGIRVRDG